MFVLTFSTNNKATYTLLKGESRGEEKMMCTPKFGLINNSDSMSSVLYRAHVV